MNLQKITSRFRWEGAPAQSTIDQLHGDRRIWALKGLAALTRKDLPASLVNRPDLAIALADEGVVLQPIALNAYLDEAVTPPESKVLALGKTNSLLLGRKNGQTLLQVEGETKPALRATQEVATELTGATLYLVQVKEDSVESFGWKWFLSAYFSRKKVIRDAFIASLVVQLIGLAFPLATQAIVDKVITNQALSTLIALGAGIALLAVFNSLMSWLRQKLLLRLANVVDAELSVRVIGHLFRLPLRYFEARQTGTLINRVQGVERVREFASGAFLLLALELPFLVVFLLLMLSYSGTLSAIVLSTVAVLLGLSLACGPYLRSLANKQFEAGAKVQSFLTERVAANETIKSLQLEPTTVGRFAELNRAQLDASLRFREFGSGYSTGAQLLEQLMNAAVLCVGAYTAMTSTSLTIGMLVAFQMFAQRVSQPLLKLSGLWQELQQVRTAVAQLGDVMSTPAEKYGSSPTSAGRPQGDLEVQGLGFRHASDRPPLYSNLAFSLKAGQVALVTGASGSGKSTLTKIMLALYPNYEGFVRLDGRDIRSMTVNELRNRFGVVPQETVLFAGSILENLTAGSNASLEEAAQACKLAGVHTLIESLPNGYQTVVGERGTGLSGGQRQRIGIARALLKRPTVLVFDEATSGLDETSAEHIGHTINSLRGKVTILFIAHKVPKSLQPDIHIRI